jgi:hypothetical protein
VKNRKANDYRKRISEVVNIVGMSDHPKNRMVNIVGMTQAFITEGVVRIARMIPMAHLKKGWSTSSE